MPPQFLLPFLLCIWAVSARAQTDQVAYDNALQNGWVSYSWATVNYTNTSPIHGTGGASISVSATNYQALYLHHTAQDSASFAALTFWIHGGTSGGQTLRLQALVDGNAQTAVALAAPTANTWTQVSVPLSSLGLSGQSSFDGFWIQSTTGNTLPTFYVDDIVLTGVAPPANVQLTADAGSVVRTVDARMFGLNTAIWDSQLGTADTRTLLANAGIKALRYPGGSISDQYAWQTNRDTTNNTLWASGFPMFAAQAAALGAQPYLTVNYGSGTPEQAAAWVAYTNGDPANTTAIGTDSKGRNWQTVGYWASLRTATPLSNDDGYNFLRVGRAAGWGFKYWEVGNECYGSWEHDEHSATQDPYTYAQAFAAFRAKMRAVDATVKIGAVVTGSEDSYGNSSHSAANPRTGATHTGWTPVVLASLKTLGALPDFLTFHDYPQEPGQESDAGLLATASTLPARDAAALRQMLTDYIANPAAAGIELALTELNDVTYNPGKQSTSLVDGLFLAETISSLASTEFNVCTWWDLRNSSASGNNSASLYGWRQFGDYGLVATGDRGDTPVNTPYPSYRAFELLAHWAVGGDQVVAAASNYTPLTVHAALRANGDLCLLVINRSPSAALTAQVALSHFVPGASTATVYQYGPTNDTNNAGLTTMTLSGVGSSFSATFPAYSMTVIDLPRAATSTPYTSWQGSHFTAAELGNSAVSGDNADPDGDGIVNLMEYALGLDPKAAGRAGLPTVSRTIVESSSYLTLTYTKVKADTDLTYLVEVSGDLQTWNGGSAYTTDISTVDQGTTQQVTTRDLTPAAAGVRRFMRLRVTR